jgi:hypothetical protein
LPPAATLRKLSLDDRRRALRRPTCLPKELTMTRIALSLTVLLASLSMACSGAEGGTADDVVTVDPPKGAPGEATTATRPAAPAPASAPAAGAAHVVTGTTAPKAFDGSSKDGAY